MLNEKLVGVFNQLSEIQGYTNPIDISIGYTRNGSIQHDGILVKSISQSGLVKLINYLREEKGVYFLIEEGGLLIMGY